MEMSDYFTFVVPNAKFTPSFKARVWDGKIRLFNRHSELLYCGLIPQILKFAKERDYRIGFEGSFVNPNPISEKETAEFLNSLQIHSKGKPLILLSTP